MSKFDSEITEIMSNANKASALLRILDNDYSIFDTQNPSDTEKQTYASGCGEIYVFLEFIEECISNIRTAVEPMIAEV